MITQHQDASLTLVGSGIKSISHLTVEAKAYITQAEKVLYLVNEPILQEWIEKQNPSAESLDKIYFKFPMRIDCYHAITNYILETLKKPCHLCVVIYGHPCVFAQPGLNAAKQAKASGYDARILPGISADACLFSDLMINPADCGLQSFEATDFLIYKRDFSTTSHLLLWQIGSIGQLGHIKKSDYKNELQVLIDYLCKTYPPSHQVTVYQASQYPHEPPTISTHSLNKLCSAPITRLSTLYVPPVRKINCDNDMLETLGLSSFKAASCE